MKEINSPTLHYNSERQWWGERIEGVRETVLALKQKEIKVMLKPHIWIGHGSFTGQIRFTNEEHWKTLEQQYELFILDFARLAEETKCEMFCIGTELNSFAIERPIFWSSLINKVRACYNGGITYAENWDTYQSVPFWNQLDYIGVDAYFPITNKQTFTLLDLDAGWSKYKNDLLIISQMHNKPILFTEYGYRSCDYAAQEPWSNNQHPVNLGNQKLALEALFNKFWDEPWFAGGFLWKWYDTKEAGGDSNSDYTPQNKPAENVIREVYRAR